MNAVRFRSSLLVLSVTACGSDDAATSAETEGSSSGDASGTTAPTTTSPTTTSPTTATTGVDESSSGTDASEGSESTAADTSGSTTSADPVCGDSNVDAEEQCDDGNRVDSDGCNSDCVVSGSMLWELVHDTQGMQDCAYDVEANVEGQIAIAGESQSTDGDTYDILAASIDVDGGLSWDMVYDSASNVESGGGLTDRGYGVAIEDDGEVVVAGHEFLTAEHVWLRKLDATGGTLWTRTGPDTADGRAYGVALGGAGEVFLFGTHGLFAFVTKYNDNGVEFWTEERKGTDGCNGCDRFWRGTATDDGGVIVGGSLDNTTGDFFLGRFENNGNDGWQVLEDGDSMGQDYALGVAGNGGSTLVVTSFDMEPGAVRSYDVAGNLEWTLPDIAPAGANLLDVDATSDGGFVTLSNGWGGEAVGDVATVTRYDSAGGVLWTQELITAPPAYHEVRAITVDGNDRVIVAGCRTGDAWVVSLAP